MTLNTCTHSLLHAHVTGNSGGIVRYTVTDGTFSGCNSPVTFTGSWTVHQFGFPVHIIDPVFGTMFVWPAKWTKVKFHTLGGDYLGDLTTGIGQAQDATGTDIGAYAQDAGTFSGPLTGTGKFDYLYKRLGAAATWSLT